LKKVERQTFDLDKTYTSDRFVIESREHGKQKIENYVFNFKWDETKFSKTNLSDMLKNMNLRVMLIDTDMRSQIMAYQEKSNLLNQMTKKEQGTIITRDLTDILKYPVVNSEDFVYTNHITSLVAIVPKSQVDNWKSNYENFNNYVVPSSTKLFNYEDKDGYSLWRVIILKAAVPEFVDECKKFKIVVREFNYSTRATEDREKQKTELKAQTESLSTKLLEKCITYFSELYQAYTHMKVLKLLIDCVMRFGIKEPIVTCVIRPVNGKEIKLHQSLTKLLADPKNLQMGLYGSKEEIDDSEDFYPYAFVSVNIPA